MKQWHAIVRTAPGQTTEVFCTWGVLGKPIWAKADSSFPTVQLYKFHDLAVGQAAQVARVEKERERGLKEAPPWEYKVRSAQLIDDLLTP